MSLPTGTVTFLFTDIEGSTKLAQQHRDQWESLRARHHAILQQAMQAHDGHVFQTIGDAFCVAFHTAADALKAAVDAQSLLQQEAWSPAPVKVRMGIHTGTAQASSGDDHAGGYQGYAALARVQRLMSAGHGGQVLVSLAAEELLHDELPEDVTLRDMGARRLKDLVRPEHIYQLVISNLPAEFPPLKTLDAYRHNLPIQLTSFIGREQEMKRIEQSIGEHRLVTLTGVGGTGKTRLALQVAADLIDRFPDGVWVAELASVSDPDLIPQAILNTLGVHEQQGRTVLQVLTDYFRERKLLLVLDNCEHLIQASAKLADTFLHQAHSMKILATSREALGVDGEAIWHVPSLSVPDVHHLPDLERLTQYEAVRLFIERALLVQPDFAVTSANAPPVTQICVRLDGIPLAIELAASRVRSLNVDQIARRLDDRFRLLTGGSRTALERHQTLRATIDWSYNLLSDEERTALRRLSAFMGGCTLAAAEAVCDNAEILDLLTQLADKSLVVVDHEHGDETRYALLETIRQYALEKLIESGESEAIRRRHAEFFTTWVGQMAMELRAGPTQLERFEQLEPEQSNVGAALEWSLGGADSELGLRLVGAIWYFWWRAGHWAEWERWLTLAPAHMALVSEATRAETLVALCGMELYVKRHTEEAGRHGRAALELHRRLGDPRNIAWAIFWLNTTGSRGLLGMDDEYAQALSLTEEALTLLRQAGDLAGIAQALTNLSIYAYNHGDHERSKAAGQESLEIAIKIGDQLREHIQYGNLGEIAMNEGDYEAAVTLFKRSLVWAGRHGNSTMVLSGLANLARACSLRGGPERTARLFGAGEALSENLGVQLQPSEVSEYDRSAALVREQLGEATFQALRAEGRAMKMEQAIEYALDTDNV